MEDVNGTRYHLLLTESDWLRDFDGVGPVVSRTGALDDVKWTAATGLQLRGRDRLLPDPGEGRLTPDDRRGAARDRHGVWWVVDEARTGLDRMADDGRTRAWPPDEPPETEDALFRRCRPKPADPPAELGGVAATADHRLVVGALDPPGLLVFDLLAGGLPVAISWAVVPGGFRPIDMVAMPGGGVAILDADPGVRKPRIWRLDHTFRPPDIAAESEPPVFVPATGPAHERSRRRATWWEFEAERPTAIDVLPGGDLLVLDPRDPDDRADAVLLRLHDGELASTLPLADAIDAGFPLDPHDMAVAATDDGVALFVSATSGDQVFAFDLGPAGEWIPRRDHIPIRLHHGRGLVAAAGTAWFDTRERWFPIRAHGRRRYVVDATLATRRFDSGRDGCVWHRLALDGCLPPGTSVQVESRAADSEAELLRTPWRQEPDPYRRRGGSELPFDLDRGQVDGSLGTWETLLQECTGRYAQLRLTVAGTGTTSPQLHALRLWFPRFSYLHEYLPAVYAERDRGTRFLERFLANPEGLFTDLEGRLADVQLLFDHRTAPSVCLDWLASWLGVLLDPAWSDLRRRAFLAWAPELFRRRGTPTGLRLALELATSECPDRITLDGDPRIRIVERFATRRLGAVVPGEGVSDPVVAASADRWRPDDGAAALHQRYRTFLLDRHSDLATLNAAWGRPAGSITLPVVRPLLPESPGEARDWQGFLAVELGIREPLLTAGDLARFRRHLLQRYRRIGALAEAYGLPQAPASFDAVELPTRLPDGGPALRDWVDMVSCVVPIAASAHRFTVLVPIVPGTSDEAAALAVGRASQVIRRERPAHTSFEVRPFLSAFRLGDVLLGLDTRLSAVGRFSALVVGEGKLAAHGLTFQLPRALQPCSSTGLAPLDTPPGEGSPAR